MTSVTLNSAPVNRSQHREESGVKKGFQNSEARKAAKFGLGLALGTAVGATLVYSAASSPGPGPAPVPTPVQDFLKNRVSLPVFSTQIPGICPIADKYFGWKIMQLLNQRITQYVSSLATQAQTTSYDTYSSPQGGDFRYGISNGTQCERRDWPKNTADSVWHTLEKKSDQKFKFARKTDYGAFGRLDITCTANNDTLTCDGTLFPAKNPLHPTSLDPYLCEYTASETKGGTITETLQAKSLKAGADLVQETNNAPLLLNQLLNF
jgi:hypothetical protein